MRAFACVCLIHPSSQKSITKIRPRFFTFLTLMETTIIQDSSLSEYWDPGGLRRGGRTRLRSTAPARPRVQYIGSITTIRARPGDRLPDRPDTRTADACAGPTREGQEGRRGEEGCGTSRGREEAVGEGSGRWGWGRGGGRRGRTRYTRRARSVLGPWCTGRVNIRRLAR